MEGTLQFVAIIVTVLLAVGGGFWKILTTIRREVNQSLEKGFAEAKEAREKGFAEAKEAREKGFAEAKEAREKGFAEAKEAWERRFAEAEKAREKDSAAAEKNFAEVKDTWEKNFAEAKDTWEKNFAEAKEARQEGFAAAEKAREQGFAAAEKAREKGFAAAEKGFEEAKEERREIKDDMNRRFDAVETRIARLEAPYFQRSAEDQGVRVGRVAEPRPSDSYPVAGGDAGRVGKTRGRKGGTHDRIDPEGG